jgi:PAS domain S-box-containing protein
MRMLRKNIRNLNRVLIVVMVVLIGYLTVVMSLGTDFMKTGKEIYVEGIVAGFLSFFSFITVLFVTMRLSGLTRGLKLDDRRKVTKAETVEDSKYKVMIQNSLDIITIIDTAGNIQYQSPSIERLLGYMPDDLVGQSIFELIHAEDHSILRYALERQSHTFLFSFRIQHRDGTWLYFESNGTNLLDNPLIAGIVLNSRDITDRKKEEDQRKQKEMAALKINLEREKTEKERDAVEREKRIIEEGKKKLEEAYKIIEEKQEEITDSINYAFRIQNAIVPRVEDIRRTFEKSFVLWRPKDIVSGDFYWYADKDRYKILAVADCTGHGVPGAFMTMIGNTLLNQIVLQEDTNMPDQILNQLHLGVRKALRQDQEGSKSRDGMDITLMMWDKEEGRVYLAGANNPVVVIRGEEILEYKPDKMSVGGLQLEEQRIFTLQEHSLQAGDAMYLYSDGFQDQFGGDEGRKFMVGKLKKLLQEVSTMPMDSQRELLIKAIEDWMGTEYEQIDDILLVGLQFPN